MWIGMRRFRGAEDTKVQGYKLLLQNITLWKMEAHFNCKIVLWKFRYIKGRKYQIHQISYYGGFSDTEAWSSRTKNQPKENITGIKTGDTSIEEAKFEATILI